MDHLRNELDELMGKDRNLPLRQKKQEHFDDPNVLIYIYIIYIYIYSFICL